jgi:PAS domain S-box-containing protein
MSQGNAPINIAGGTFADMDEHIDRAFRGARVSFERRERKATGELRWVRITLFPDRAVAGRVDGIFAVMTDIDDDIAIRDALRAQEVQLRLFADNIPGPIAYLDRLSTYTFVNQAFANWVRLPQDQIYGRTPFEVLAPDVASFLRPVLERARAGEHVEYERVDSPPVGAQRWVHGRIAPDFDAEGRLRGLYCTEYDIDDLKRTEQALAAREEQLRLFTDNIPDPVVYLDTDRHYAFVNDAFLQFNGLDRAASHRQDHVGRDRSRGDHGAHAVPGPGLRRRDRQSTSGRWSTRRADRAGSAAGWCRITGSTARSRASTSSCTTSPTSRARRTRWQRAKVSCGQ